MSTVLYWGLRAIELQCSGAAKSPLPCATGFRGFGHMKIDHTIVHDRIRLTYRVSPRAGTIVHPLYDGVRPCCTTPVPSFTPSSTVWSSCFTNFSL